jgi:hypothetical protein
VRFVDLGEFDTEMFLDSTGQLCRLAARSLGTRLQVLDDLPTPPGL